MNQPHIHEVGAFDPVQAFTETFSNMAKMLAGLKEDPQALPPEEIIRAATLTVDLLETIATVSTASLMASVGKFIDPDVYREARINYMSTRSARTPEEDNEYRASLMRKVAVYIPHETDFPSPD